MKVDPRHRLVAETLETEWNQALRELADAKEEHERHASAIICNLTIKAAKEFRNWCETFHGTGTIPKHLISSANAP